MSIDEYVKIKKEKNDLSIKDLKINEKIEFNKTFELKFQGVLNFKKIYLVLSLMTVFFFILFSFFSLLFYPTHLLSVITFVLFGFSLLFSLGFFVDYKRFLRNLNISLKKNGKNVYKSKNITKNNLNLLKNDNKELYLQKKITVKNYHRKLSLKTIF